MKPCIVIALILVGLPRAIAEEAKFTSSLSKGDLAAAGISELTPAQRARLNALVEDYKSGAITSARRATDDALAAKKAAEAKAALAEKKAEAARIEAAAAEAKRLEAKRIETAKVAGGQGLLAKTRAALQPAKAADVAAIESSIPGKFRGWESRQVFTLANGQRWQIANSESYYSPVTENPKVVIVPAALAGYWMRFPTLGREVRVNFLGEN